MKTVQIIYDGVRLLVPLIGARPLHLPHDGFADFATYCGPGKWGDLIVPDDIYDTPINPACYIHDEMVLLAEPTWVSFHHTNSVFLHNINTILEHFDVKERPSSEQEHKYKRYYRAVTYYMAVDSRAGANIFWDLKREQEMI